MNKALLLAVFTCFLMALPETFGATVFSCDENELALAISGGGTVTFACEGTITLSRTIIVTTNTVLDTEGAHVTISGNHAVRVFYVNPGVILGMFGITVADGLSNEGGGVYNDHGLVNLVGSSFIGNQAVGLNGTVDSPTPGSGRGGAVFNLGQLYLYSSLFASNTALGGSSCNECVPSAGGEGFGGAIFNLG